MFKYFIVALGLSAYAFAGVDADISRARLLYECRPLHSDVVDLISIWGARKSRVNELGSEEIVAVSTDVGSFHEARAVLNLPSSEGQAYQLFSTRDGKTKSGDFIVTIYNGKDKGFEVAGLYVLFPTTKRIEAPIRCTNMR